MASVTLFLPSETHQRDESDAVILDVDMLGALAVDLHRSIHIDCLRHLWSYLWSVAFIYMLLP